MGTVLLNGFIDGGKNRVGIYNRCSTEEEAQMNALEIQVQESREIAERMGWVVTAQYIESESGTSTKKRLEYQRLMDDIENDVFDMIMIKSIDRLMRSTKDWYLFIDKVVTYGIKLYIYIDNKFYDAEDSLITGMKAILAEDFSRELSKKIKNAHKRRQEKKSGFNFTVPVFGWTKVEKDKYVVNEEEAVYYRLAFAMAYEGKGFYSIAKYMNEQGIVNRRTGKPLSETQWRKMIYSPRAHGTVVLHTREYDFNTKKYVNVPENEWVYIENALPPIVSKEYQEMVLEELRKRNGTCNFKNYTRDRTKTGKYDLSKKLICGCCGSVYYRISYHKSGNKTYVWKCRNKYLHGKNACQGRNVFEDSTIDTIEKACKDFYENTYDSSKEYFIEKTLRIAKQVFSSDYNEKELKKLEKELSEQEQKKEILMNKLMNEVINDEEFKCANRGVSTKIADLKRKIEEVKRNMGKLCGIEDRLLKIRTVLSDGKVIDKAKTKDLLKKIEKVVVCPDGNLEVLLQQYDKITVPYVHKMKPINSSARSQSLKG